MSSTLDEARRKRDRTLTAAAADSWSAHTARTLHAWTTLGRPRRCGKGCRSWLGCDSTRLWWRADCGCADELSCAEMVFPCSCSRKWKTEVAAVRIVSNATRKQARSWGEGATVQYSTVQRGAGVKSVRQSGSTTREKEKKSLRNVVEFIRIPPTHGGGQVSVASACCCVHHYINIRTSLHVQCIPYRIIRGRVPYTGTRPKFLYPTFNK